MKNKIVIVGAGNVGSMTAYTLMLKGLCREIVLIDRNQDKAWAEAADMFNASCFNESRCDVRSGGYDECKDASIVIITASAPMDPATLNDRIQLLNSSKMIMKSIISSVMESGFDGILIIVSNPVDIMTYYAYRLSHLPRERVIGSGTTLDSIRLREYIGKIFDVDTKSVFCQVIGEHGSSSVPVLSHCLVGGQKLEDAFSKSGEKRKTKEELIHATVEAGFDIFRKKGNTSYGIASSVAEIVKAIVFDEKRVLPVCYTLKGEYSLNDLSISVPCVLNEKGVKEVVELSLSNEEEQAFYSSAEKLSSYDSSLED